MAKINQLLSITICYLIRGYQIVFRPFLGNRCRFHPSCSDYAMAALKSYGPIKGSWLSAYRLLRCQPFHPGGIDPVPPKPNL